MRLEPREGLRTEHLTRLPLGPGREAYSRRTRTAIAVVLAVSVGVVLLVGVLLATSGPAAVPRSVTIPAPDRNAAPALLRAAEAIGFEPTAAPGAGAVESEPVALGPVASASGLLAPGAVAPPFALRTATGAPLSLASLRGRTVLLEFFATWCPHCAAEAPHLKALYAALPHPRFAFVSIDADGETAPSVLAYEIYFGLPFPTLLDPGSRPGSFHDPGSAGPVTRAYSVGEYPTFYVIDGRGRVVWAAQGEQPDALLLRELRSAARAGARAADLG